MQPTMRERPADAAVDLSAAQFTSSPGAHTSSDARSPAWLRYGVMALATGTRARGADASQQLDDASHTPARRSLAEPRTSGGILHTRTRIHRANASVPVFTTLAADATPADHLLGSQPVIFGGMWLAKRNETFFVRDDLSAPGRNPSVISLLRDVNRWYPDLPDFGPVYACTEGYQPVCQGNAPDNNIPGDHAFAIHLDKNRPRVGWRPVPHLVPDNTFQDWALVGIPNYEETCVQMSRAGDQPPQTALAGWVGNIETNPFRKTLMEIAAAQPEHIEAINTGQWKDKATGDGIEVSLGERMSMSDLVKRYAYLIDVEGAYSSFRLKMLYHSNRPVLVQERRFDEFWTSQVTPWVHYVPVAYDLHDLFERVAWLKFNPDEGAAIAGRAREFARRHLRRGHAVERWGAAIRELPPVKPASV